MTKIFADGAMLSEIAELNKNSLIEGFTTNPSLMRKAGVDNYTKFSKEVLNIIGNKPISFEVFADEFNEMKKQAEIITKWGQNVYVKIPIMNSKGAYSFDLIKELSKEGIKLNITAILKYDQVKKLFNVINKDTGTIVSIFAGRIADTGVDPISIMSDSINLFKEYESCEILWASPREVLNFYQAKEIGCHIITVTKDIINKLSLKGKDLESYSRETVETFYKDALSAGYSI